MEGFILKNVSTIFNVKYWLTKGWYSFKEVLSIIGWVSFTVKIRRDVSKLLKYRLNFPFATDGKRANRYREKIDEIRTKCVSCARHWYKYSILRGHFSGKEMVKKITRNRTNLVTFRLCNFHGMWNNTGVQFPMVSL